MSHQYLITPELEDVPVDEYAEPDDAGIEHGAPEDNE